MFKIGDEVEVFNYPWGTYNGTVGKIFVINRDFSYGIKLIKNTTIFHGPFRFESKYLKYSDNRQFNNSFEDHLLKEEN